jgi:hypothetical protein
MGGCNSTAFLSKWNLCVGSIPHESKVIPITDNWIRLAPRATGLRRKQACVGNDSVVFPYHVRSVRKIQPPLTPLRKQGSGRSFTGLVKYKHVLGMTLNCITFEGQK